MTPPERRNVLITTCFLAMGFGEKTAFYGGKKKQRTLNLDKTYENIIKPAVLGAGFGCVRADEIQHSTVIDKPMYEQLLQADIVVADLSTSNANAIYELGVRIRDQVDNFYRPNAEKNECNAALYGHLGQVLNAVAAVLGAVGAIWGGGYLEAWVAVAGTIAAALSSYALGKRFERLAATYRVTADRLAVRLALWGVTTLARPDPAADRALVLDAERIMAAENEAWLAEFLKDPTAPAQAVAR